MSSNEDDQIALAPDELVDYVVERLAYSGNLGAPIDTIWGWLAEKVGVLDQIQHQLIWNWLLERPDEITVASGFKSLSPEKYYNRDLPAVQSEYPDLHLYATENLQWTTLTGKSKEGNAIGGKAFELLGMISESRARGVTNLELAKRTGQDPRSFHGRTSLLLDLGLIKRYPVISDSFNTYLNVYHKFVQQQEDAHAIEGHFGINVPELRKIIVTSAKQSKNGLRPIYDLKEELGFGKKPKQQRFLSIQIRKLEEQGYIQRVIVTMKASKNIKAKCIKFLKDLPEKSEDQGLDEFDSCDSDEFQNEEIDESADEETVDAQMSDEPIISEEIENTNAPSPILFNTIFPLETQLCYAVSQSGTDGMPVRDLCKKITGGSYVRGLSRLLDDYVDIGKKNRKIPAHLRNLEILRGTDFEARTKYFRYFTRENYCKLAGKPMDESWGSLGPYKPSTLSLEQLNSKHRGPLPGAVNIYREASGKEFVAFHGELASMGDAVQVTENMPVLGQRKRGRPRKDQSESSVGIKKARGRPKKTATTREKKDEDEKEIVEQEESMENIVREVISESKIEKPEEITSDTFEHGEQGSAREVKEMEQIDENEKKLEIQRLRASKMHSDQSDEVHHPRKPLNTSAHNKRIAQQTSKIENETNDDANDVIQISLATTKREALMIKVLTMKGGVYEGGNALIRLLKETSGESLDRRTMLRTIEGMELAGKLRRTVYSVPGEKITAVPKYYLTLPDVPADSPLIEQCKQRLKDSVDQKGANVSTGSNPLVKLESDFQYYYLTDKNRKLNKAIERLTKSTKPKELPAQSSAITGKFLNEVLATSSPRKKTGKPRSKSDRNENSIEKETMSQPRKSHQFVSRKRGSNKSQEEQELFYRTVIISRSIYYNNAGIIQWDKIAESWSKQFDSVTPASCKIRWTRVRDLSGGAKMIESAIKRWETLFLSNYENQEIKRIEDENDVDLVDLARFWKSKEGQLVNSSSLDLYRDIDDNLKEYAFKTRSNEDIFESIQNSNSMVRAEELLTNYAFGFDPGMANQTDSTDIQEAEQAIKGIIATPSDIYNAEDAKRILDKKGIRLCEQAVDNLTKRRSIVYIPRDREKVMPGRNFMFTDKLNSFLQLKLGNDIYQEISDFEDELVKILCADRSFELPRAASDSQLICLLDFICYKDVELSRRELTPETLAAYKSRHIDKEKLDIDVDILKGEEISLVKRPNVNVPGKGQKAAFIWIDTEGGVSENMWRKIVSAVLWSIAMRPGISKDVLMNRWSILLTDKELNVLLDYLLKKECIEQGDEESFYGKSRWYSHLFE